MENSILAACDLLISQIQQIRAQVQNLIKENDELRSRRDSLEAQVMEMAQEWWDNIVFLVDEDGDDAA